MYNMYVHVHAHAHAHAHVVVVVFPNLQTPKPPWILLQGSSASRAEALGRPLTTSPNRSHAYVLILLLDAGVTLG